MGKKQYNSATDRRWQQRYQRIQERKENVFDVETPREQRRRNKKTLYKTKRIDIERLIPNKVAVLCTSPEQIRQLYYAVEKWKPEYARWRSLDGLESIFYFCENATVGIITEDFPFFEKTAIKVEPKEYFVARGVEVVDFFELLPVIDLGEFCVSLEAVDYLLGI